MGNDIHFSVLFPCLLILYLFFFFSLLAISFYVICFLGEREHHVRSFDDRHVKSNLLRAATAS